MHEKSVGKIIILGITLLVFALSWQVISFFIDVLIMGAVTAYVAYPLTKYIRMQGEKSKYKFMHGKVFAAIATFVILILPFVLMLLQLISLLTDPRGSKIILDMLYYSPTFSAKVKTGMDAIGLQAFSEIIAGKVREIMLYITSRASASITLIIAQMVIKIPLYLITTYFFIQDGPDLVKKVDGYISRGQPFLRKMWQHIDRIAHALFIGHLVCSGIAVVIGIIGYWVLSSLGVFPLENMTYVIFLGIITGIAVLLPIIGAWSIYIPLSLWILMTQPMPIAIVNAIIMFLFGLIFLTTLSDLYIRPMLIRKTGDIHPLIVVIGFIGGPLLWGVKGFVLGPLALGISQAIIETYLEYERKEK